MDEIKNNYKLIDVNLEKGLTEEEVLERVDLGQVNETQASTFKEIGNIVLKNIFTFFNVVMLLLFALLVFVSAYTDVLFIFIVLANTSINIIHEIKTKVTIKKLFSSDTFSNVLRDGQVKEVSPDDIVLNDILVLNAGEKIKVDAILKSGQVKVDESLLNGNSDLSVKNEGDYLFRGSVVTGGSCKAQVVNIKEDTYVESLAKDAKKYSKPKSELRDSLKYIVRTIVLIIIPIAFILYNNYSLSSDVVVKESIKNTAGALIRMIPSGLFLLISFVLLTGAVRLLRRKTIVQELFCVEMLAKVDTICLDKTGTITDGSMTVFSVVDINLEDEAFAPKIIIPNMMYAFNKHNETNKALLNKFGLAIDEPETLNVIEFSSKNKYSAVEFKDQGTFLIGAPEAVLVKTEYNKIKNRVNKYAKQGLRVLVYAHSQNPINNDKIPSGIKPLSLFLLEDKIRKNVIPTIEYFKAHGVDIKVISGDCPLTASNIAERAGILEFDKYISLEGLTNSEVEESATKYKIFGRANPQQKEIIVKTLQTQGEKVAMIGDGANDVLALKEADAAISLGAGCEVAVNASHIIMLDSNFKSLPKVVDEGKRALSNLQKASSLFLTKSFFLILLTVVLLMAKAQFPFNNKQLFLINIAVISIPAFILSLQPNSNNIEGHFLANVLKILSPGVLAMVAQVAIILLILGPKMGLGDLEISTLVVVTTTFTATVILHKLLRPFNLARTVIYITSMTVAALAILLIPEFFDINALLPIYIALEGVAIERLSFDVIIVLLLMLFTSSLFIDFFAEMPKAINRGVRKFFKKLSGV